MSWKFSAGLCGLMIVAALMQWIAGDMRMTVAAFCAAAGWGVAAMTEMQEQFKRAETECALRSALTTMSISAGILEKDGDEHGVAWNLRNEIAQGTDVLGIERSNVKLTGSRSAKRGGNPTAQLLGCPR